MEGIGRYVFLIIILALLVKSGIDSYKRDKNEFFITWFLVIMALTMMSLAYFIYNYW